ncbi:MAG: translation initiation factor IF-2 subunit beta [Candidatus Diapherotrites archaeon]|nr:translation initiation factor IF-2 subunit beta [Candidatus Diapherotrites archaeon]
MDYDKMLDRLYLSLPKEALTKSRFEMPVPDSFIQGTKTIVKNFKPILKSLNREEAHILKYITSEIATSVAVEGERLLLNGKFGLEQVKKIFNNYLNQFVLCKECKKPDTKFMDEHGVKLLKCTACGATMPIKKL